MPSPMPDGRLAFTLLKKSALCSAPTILFRTQPNIRMALPNACPNGEFDFTRWGNVGLQQVEPLWLLKYLPNMPASHVAIYNDFRGPSNSITLREASSNLSVAESVTTIRRGAADAVLAGSTGSRVHPLRTLHCSMQEQLAEKGQQPETASRPFDSGRTGMVIGEGAGVLILEELECALARGATIHGEIVGYGSSTVASNPESRITPRHFVTSSRWLFRLRE